MSVTYIDYEIQENIFSTPEIKTVFDETARIQRWLTIEATLAEVQAEYGAIPPEAAAEIRKWAVLDHLDLEKIKQDYRNGRNSIIPVIKALSDRCSDDHGEYVHYGITTQDVVDTGQMLELKEVLSVLYRDTRQVEAMLLKMAETHSTTVMIGRTHGQYALPITFGLKVSVWIDELRRHIERIKSLASRILVGQLSGPVGTFSALGEQALDISAVTLQRLGLSFSPIAWHVSRDNIAEFSAVLTMLSASIAKIANEIFQLSKSDVLELEEGAGAGKKMSSSAMPHKNNPVLSQRIIVIAKHVRALSGVVMESMVHENERDPRSLWAEWLSIPQISIYTAASLDNMLKLLQNLTIHPEQMKFNLQKLGEYIASEHLMMKLSRSMGKMCAQEKLHTLMQLTKTAQVSLKEALLSDAEIGPLLDEEDLKIIENPAQYIGQSQNIVQHQIKKIYQLRATEGETLI